MSKGDLAMRIRDPHVGPEVDDAPPTSAGWSPITMVQVMNWVTIRRSWEAHRRLQVRREDHGFALQDHPCSSMATGQMAAGTVWQDLMPQLHARVLSPDIQNTRLQLESQAKRGLVYPRGLPKRSADTT